MAEIMLDGVQMSVGAEEKGSQKHLPGIGSPQGDWQSVGAEE